MSEPTLDLDQFAREVELVRAERAQCKRDVCPYCQAGETPTRNPGTRVWYHGPVICPAGRIWERERC